ncbi:RHS repeat-associated core domain-containing protein [Pseudomonas sp. W2-17]|uniref:RHS repeat-associated core domain-containing protein n=1 Tax=Pseudomonas sp. W2-17 TaxID=3058039 RepID=UPI0034E0B5AC
MTNPIRFQGQYHDHETGLHYNRHRYYDPRVGRFISKDPIGYSGGLNLYHYVPNPTGWIDPLGLERIKGITPNNRGSFTLLKRVRPPLVQTGYSTTAGGSGAHHPVVEGLYDSVEIDKRTDHYHGLCGEADALSHLARTHNVQSVAELKALTECATSTTIRNDGKPQPFCPSCAQVMSVLGIKDGFSK